MLERLLRHDTEIISAALVGVAAGAIATYSGIKILSFFNRKGWSRRARELSATKEVLKKLSDKVSILGKKKNVLEVYTGDYFHTFNEAGWQEFVDLVEDLQAIESSLHILLEQGSMRQTYRVAAYLLGELAPTEVKGVEGEWENLTEFVDWQSRSNTYLLKLVRAVTTSAKETRSIGITRRHRKPTLLAMSELCKGLLEE